MVIQWHKCVTQPTGKMVAGGRIAAEQPNNDT